MIKSVNEKWRYTIRKITVLNLVGMSMHYATNMYVMKNASHIGR